MEFQIRSMASREIKEVIELLKKCDLYYPQDDTPKNLFRKLGQDKDLMLVAVDDDDKVAGFIMGSYDGWAAMVWHLAVDPKYQRDGLGTVLLKKIESHLVKKGATILYGLVLPQNGLVLSLLEKGGFKKELTTWVISKSIR